MKVLLIDVNGNSSSTGNIVNILYNYVNSTGNDAAICYGRGKRIKGKNIYKFGIDVETIFHAFLTRITGFTGCFSFFSTRRLIKFIRKYNPDVVHIHELHAYFVNYKSLILHLKKNRIKTVSTLHCEFNYTGKCGHSVECEQWKDECKKCPHLSDYISTLWFDHTNYMFKQKRNAFVGFKDLHLITPSLWLAKRVQYSFLKDYPLTVIHNGIDTNVFKPRDSRKLRVQLGIKDDEKVVLALAPHLMSPQKGGDFVIQIARILENELIRFVLIGVDGIKYEKKRNLILNGPIYDKTILSEYYSLADLFLICSERENFPTTCIEAQCCGTPIYGFDTGGIKETCVSPNYSCFTEYSDCNKMAKMILSASRKTNESINKIRTNALSEYSIDVFCKKNMELYVKDR